MVSSFAFFSHIDRLTQINVDHILINLFHDSKCKSESDTMEATAQFDFNARSERELSLRKGDLVTLRKQVSNDWWQGTVRGKDGLVPDKYISLKIKYVNQKLFQ